MPTIIATAEVINNGELIHFTYPGAPARIISG